MKNIFLMALCIGFGISLCAQVDIDCSKNMLTTQDEIRECSLQAESWCKLKMQHAQIILEKIKDKSPDEYTAEDQIVVEKLEHFWGIKPVEYGGQLPWAIETIKKVRNLAALHFIYSWEEASICRKPSDAYAHTEGVGVDNTNVYLCEGWEMRSLRCRRQTVLHEMLHLVGLQDWTEEAKERNGGLVHPVGWRMSDAENFSLCVIALTFTSKQREDMAADVCSIERARH